MTPQQKWGLGIAATAAGLGFLFWHSNRAQAAGLPSGNGARADTPLPGGMSYTPGAVAPATSNVTNYPAPYTPVQGSSSYTQDDTPRGDPTVFAYQQRLQALGYDPGPIDGRYGPLTQNAVRDFQRDNRLTVDGAMGPRTRAAIDAAYGEPAATSGLGGRFWKRY